jgi:hypothetical protein
MTDTGHPRLSIVRQCELTSISRSSFYREPTVENVKTRWDARQGLCYAGKRGDIGIVIERSTLPVVSGSPRHESNRWIFRSDFELPKAISAAVPPSRTPHSTMTPGTLRASISDAKYSKLFYRAR